MPFFAKHDSSKREAVLEERLMMRSAQQQRYRVRRYNFYMFPDDKAEREVVLNPNTVAFLNQHNMSFDMWSKHGIPFATSTEQATELLRAYTAAELQERNPLSSSVDNNEEAANNNNNNNNNNGTTTSVREHRCCCCCQ